MPSSGRSSVRRGRFLLVQRLQDALLELGAEPGERAQLLRLGRLAQLGDGRDAEVLPDPAGGLGAEPGEARERDHVGRDDGLVLRQRVHLAVLDDLDDLALDRLADPLELLGLAVERELRDRSARVADQCRRAAIGEHAEGVVAFDLEDVGEQLELRGDVSIARQRRRHDRDDRCRAARHDLPPHVQRVREPRAMLTALREVLPADGHMLVIDDATLPTTPVSWPTFWPAANSRMVCTARARRASGPRTSPASARALADGAELVARDGLRLLPRPGGRPAPAGRRGGRRPRPRLALLEGGGVRTGGAVRAGSSPRGLRLRAHRPGHGVRDLTGGFKCIPERCWRRSRSTGSTPRATPSRSRPPTAPSAPASVVEMPIVFVDREGATRR